MFEVTETMRTLDGYTYKVRYLTGQGNWIVNRWPVVYMNHAVFCEVFTEEGWELNLKTDNPSLGFDTRNQAEQAVIDNYK